MKLRDAIAMAEQLERLYDDMKGGTIWLSDFKRYIIQTHGSDEKTIKGYLNALMLFDLIKRDAYDPDRLYLTFRDSPDYKAFKESRKKAVGWYLTEEPKEEPKTEEPKEEPKTEEPKEEPKTESEQK